MKIIPAILADETTQDIVCDDGLQCRTIVSSFAAGLRVPEVGESVHGYTEISLTLSGSFTLHSGGEVARLQAGDLVTVPPGEAHFFHVDDDTRIFTITIGDA